MVLLGVVVVGATVLCVVEGTVVVVVLCFEISAGGKAEAGFGVGSSSKVVAPYEMKITVKKTLCTKSNVLFSSVSIELSSCLKTFFYYIKNNKKYPKTPLFAR